MWGRGTYNATQTLKGYLTNKYNMKQLNVTYYSLGFQQKLSPISENIDLAKLIFKNNFQKPGKTMTAYFDRTWPISNVKRNDSASQTIQVKKGIELIYSSNTYIK